MLHATETGISSDRLGLWLVCAFTFYPLMGGVVRLRSFVSLTFNFVYYVKTNLLFILL